MILVAQAGSAGLGDKAVEIMRRKSKGRNVENDQTVPDIAADALKEIRNHLKAVNQGIISSDDGWKRFFLEDNYVELMVGYFYNKIPYLFTIDIDWALPIPVNHQYKGIGIGGTMAEFFLREYGQSDPGFDLAYPISVSVIEKVVDNVDGCGRPAWVGILWNLQDGIIEHYKSTGRKYRVTHASMIVSAGTQNRPGRGR
jgi:hypothetical protein